MALDVYVGSLTRYYSGDWENAAEKIARERGVPFRVAGADEPKDKTKEANRIRPSIIAWRRKLGDALGGRIPSRLDWDESAEAPYFTARPGWDGFGSLVLWAAYSEHPALRRPGRLPEEWDDDTALVRCNAEGFKSKFGHLVRNVELWLPSAFTLTFEAEDASGRKTVIGSSETLAHQLVELNASTWRADLGTIQGWGRKAPADDDGLETHAQYACAVILNLVNFANEHTLPIKLDY
jgi:hypothetical protein